MGIKRKVFDFTTRKLIEVLRLNTAYQISCGLADLLNPIFTVFKDNVKYVF